MREPNMKQVLLEPPKWFREKGSGLEQHVVAHYENLDGDPDTDMLPINSDSGLDTEEEEEEEEEPEEPKEKTVSAAVATALTLF